MSRRAFQGSTIPFVQRPRSQFLYGQSSVGLALQNTFQSTRILKKLYLKDNYDLFVPPHLQVPQSILRSRSNLMRLAELARSRSLPVIQVPKSQLTILSDHQESHGGAVLETSHFLPPFISTLNSNPMEGQPDSCEK